MNPKEEIENPENFDDGLTQVAPKEEFNYKKIKKLVEKHSLKSYMELLKWMYDNHKEILREWEATRGKLRMEFA